MNCCKPTEKQEKFLNDLKSQSKDKIKLGKINLDKWPVEKTGSRKRIQNAISDLENILSIDPEKNAVPVDIVIGMFKKHLNNIWLNHTPENPVE